MTWKIEGGKTYNISEKNGNRFWYLNNKLHRELGPAIELVAGGGVYYFQGEKIACSSQKDFENKIALKKTATKEVYWDCKIETMVPAILSYRILAKTPEEAATKAKTASPNHVQYKLAHKRDKKLTIYEAGKSIVRFIKNMVS